MTKNSLLFSFVVLASQLAFGTIKSVQVVEGTASGVDVQTTSAGVQTFTIFGGYTGDVGDCETTLQTGTGVCNSCAGGSGPSNICTTAPFACAEKSIYPNLLLGITLAMDPIPANPAIRVEIGGTANTITADSSSTIPGSAGQTFTVYVRWSDICGKGGASGGDTTCKNAQSTTLNVGLVDSVASPNAFASGNYQQFSLKHRYQDNTDTTLTLVPTENPTSSQGFSQYRVLPGDGKAYVRELQRGGTGPNDSSGIRWSALRVYYAEAPGAIDFCTIPVNADSAGYADLTVVDKTKTETSLSQEYITGLENDVNYMFTIASVDEGSIVTNFLKEDGGNTDHVDRYTAMPGDVVGLLDKKKCFIATAAFGSPMDAHVEMLRTFRDRILGRNWAGKEFIKFYYKHSPPLAQFIAEHDSLRAVVRGILWPIIFFAELALGWGVFAAFFVYALGIGGLISLVYLLRHGRRWRKA